MTTVAKAFGIVKLTDGDVGVEIEVEGKGLPLRVKDWLSEVDGSLKGEESREFVLAKPSSLIEVRKALDNLDKAYIDMGTRVDNTVRAGVHVHINCQHLTMTQLVNFMVCYLIIENVLVKWCGDFREGNLFCLRACDADDLLRVLIEAFRGDRKHYKLLLRQDHYRYASMNVKALGDYGSLEFRAMRGTRDLDVIYKWAEALYGLREFSKTFKRPSDIVEAFSIESPEGFFQMALGKHAKEFTPKNKGDLIPMLTDGMRCAQDVAYARDWDSFEPKMKTIGGLEFEEDSDANEPDEDF